MQKKRKVTSTKATMTSRRKAAVRRKPRSMNTNASVGLKSTGKKAAKYTKDLLDMGTQVLEQGVETIEYGAEKLGNALLKPFRSS